MTVTVNPYHGTYSDYVAGCRCDQCKAASADYARERRQAKAELPAVHPVEPTPFWFRFAACRPEYADRPIDQWVDQFFPEPGASVREAKATCAECPAQDACRDHGLAEEHGIWGGTSERERRRLRLKLAQHTPPIPAA